MVDATVRRRLAPVYARVACPLAAAGVRAWHVTALGLAAGAAASVLAALELWPAALAALLVNRALDGLDGVLARMRGASALGGFADFAADLAVYGGFLVGVAVALPEARLAAVVLLAVYYVNVGLWLTYASLAERHGQRGGDERSLRFVGGLAEASETTIAYVLICLLPEHAATVAWAFAGVVAVTIGQRLWLAARTLPHS